MDIPTPYDGTPLPPADAPTAQRPSDPLNKAIDPAIVRREIPIVTTNTYWTPPLVRSAFAELVAGQFDATGQLIDSMVGDSRICASLDSRVGGLLGRPIEMSIPRRFRDSDLAKECLDAFRDNWSAIAPEPMLSGLQAWTILLGHGPAQIIWSTDGEYTLPMPQVWHPRYTRFDWMLRKHVAYTMDGPAVIEPGSGHWILHAPHGEYRGWMRGAVRAVAPWWLARNYALRDASRWSEIHGLPLKKLKHPASADREKVAYWLNAIASMGGETCVDLPQNVTQGEGNSNYDIEFLEAQGTSFDGFFKLIDACDREITLSLLAQTLTSSVGPEGRGSYAAARVHADVRQALLQADARALARTVYLQIARPFALMNFGNADLAPEISWNIEPYEDAKTKVETFAVLTQGLNVLKQAGLQIEDVQQLAKSFGLDLGQINYVAKGAEIYQYDLQYGIVKVNEARARKGLPPLEDGDRFPSLQEEDPKTPNKAAARFASAASAYARFRIATGAGESELLAEAAALEEMISAERRAARRARR